MGGAFLAHHRGRSRLAVALIGAAGLVKLYPLALLPAFWRRGDWTALGLLAVMAAAAYAPYAVGAGWQVFGYLPGYLAEEGFQTGDRFFLIDLARRLIGTAPSPAAYMAVAGLGLCGLSTWFVVRGPLTGRAQMAAALLLAAAATLVISPAYPWYFLWLLPCLAVVPSLPLLVVTAAGFVQYVRHVPGAAANGFDLNLVQYGGFALVAVGVGLARRAARRTRRSIISGDTA
jgi:hypothetical protein